MNVSKMLSTWYIQNKRDLPWRSTSDPYKIWLSEIILQQTRIIQGIDYYERFLNRFPTVNDLANASIEEVLKIWEGLGYYSRARNLHLTAQIVSTEFGGKFPNTFEGLRNLKGIGDYTASAIASISFNLPNAAVDGNVYRVLARFFGIYESPFNARGKQFFQTLAQEILDHKYPGRHNQSIMELGALVCTPKSPKCEQCPLAESCIALEKKSISKLPVRKTKITIRSRYLYYIVILRGDKTYIQQRKEGDIWALLFEFPCIETLNNETVEHILTLSAWKSIFGDSSIVLTDISPVYKHQLSHQLLHATFIKVKVSENFIGTNFIELEINELDNYPFPRLIGRYFAERMNFKNH